jgi:hypothetical protein
MRHIGVGSVALIRGILISLPDFDPNPPSTGPKPFHLKLNATVEILESDANATRLDAIFWIETVEQADGGGPLL